MSLGDLIARLEVLRERCGPNAVVRVLDGDGDWSIEDDGVRVEPELTTLDGAAVVVIDLTA